MPSLYLSRVRCDKAASPTISCIKEAVEPRGVRVLEARLHKDCGNALSLIFGINGKAIEVCRYVHS